MHLQLQRLSKRFANIIAIDDISFAIQHGELISLVGPSGCGKTTTLRLIAGLEQPDTGDILIDGKSILSQAPEERSVGFVFQNYALFPHMNVVQNIAYGLKFVRDRLDYQPRVLEMLKLVGLEGFEERTPPELSAGQQQRVALARALAPRPTILLLDEPLSALDAKLRERLRVEIRSVQRQLSITTLYVTHDQEEALAISDRVAVMYKGRLEQIDTPERVYDRPLTAVVARFIGRGNLIEAQVTKVTSSQLHLSLPDGQEFFLSFPAAQAMDSKTVVNFLVRPEDISLNSQKEIRLHGRWKASSFLGDAILGYFDSGNQEWVVKLGRDAILPPEGAVMEFSFDRNDCVMYGLDR
jgi:thiamine transport system ATP-binding protein